MCELDGGQRGANAAELAGVKTILVKTGYAGKDGKYDCTPDFVTDNLGSAVELVMKVLDK